MAQHSTTTRLRENDTPGHQSLLGQPRGLGKECEPGGLMVWKEWKFCWDMLTPFDEVNGIVYQ